MKERIKNLLEKFKNTINWAKTLELKTLKDFKNLVLVILLVDIFGLYWYLKMETLGKAMLVVCLIFLAVILFLERAKDEEKPKPKEKDDKKPKGGTKKMGEDEKPEEPKEPEQPEEPEEDMGLNLGLDLGLPNSEDYNKRVAVALGSY